MYKVFLFYAQCVTEVVTHTCFVKSLLLRHFLTSIKADSNSTDKLFRNIFRDMFQNIKPFFLFFDFFLIPGMF